MDRQEKTIRIGGAVLCGILVAHLFGGGIAEAVVETFSNYDAVSMLMYLETGRVVRFLEPETTEPAQPVFQEATESTQSIQETQGSDPEAAVFLQSDAQLVEVYSYCGYDADVADLLAKPLQWDLTQQAPTVLIVHSHATESYRDTDRYEPSGDYRTLDTGYNVVAVGAALKKALEAGGVEVIHDTTLHDYPSYSESYGQSRATVQSYLDKYPSIAMVLDIHRDSVVDDSGEEMCFTAGYNGQDAAQLMLVVGTDAGGLTHPDWSENMSLAVKLHAQLEKTCSGICRPISFRSQRFNQDLSTGALLLEVGGAGNSLEEAMTSVEILAEAILALSAGARQTD